MGQYGSGRSADIRLGNRTWSFQVPSQEKMDVPVLKEVENSPFLFFGVLSWALID